MPKYTLYEKKVSSTFCGNGVETLVCSNDTIKAHVRGWDNSQVVEDFTGNLQGKPESERGKGWRKLTGEKARAAQAWAADQAEA